MKKPTRAKSGGSLKIDGKTLAIGQVTVYRPRGNPTTITGNSVDSIDVRDGALVVLNASGKAHMAFGPGQWTTVNVQPA